MLPTVEQLACWIYEATEYERSKEDGEPNVWIPWDAQTSSRERRIYLKSANTVLQGLKALGT